MPFTLFSQSMFLQNKRIQSKCLRRRRLAHPSIIAIGALGALVFSASNLPAQLPPWESLEFEASKLFITAHSSITAIKEDASTSQAQWTMANFRGRAPRGPTTLRLTTQAKMLGRTSLNTVWLNPETMAAYQRSLQETGSRMRRKTYRFGAAEVLALRSSPATDEERKLPEPRWTKRSEQRIAIPTESSEVTDPVAIFFVIATMPFAQLDEGYELAVLSSNRISRVRIQRTKGTLQTRSRAVVIHSDGSTVRGGASTDVTTKLYRVTPLSAEGELKLLGLEGAIDIVVDETFRIPLEIRGRIPPVGKVAVTLVRAKLR